MNKMVLIPIEKYQKLIDSDKSDKPTLEPLRKKLVDILSNKIKSKEDMEIVEKVVEPNMEPSMEVSEDKPVETSREKPMETPKETPKEIPKEKPMKSSNYIKPTRPPGIPYTPRLKPRNQSDFRKHLKKKWMRL
jgi:hypothetical protein